MAERIDYLDKARGVAMICIVMLHLTIFNMKGTASVAVGDFCHSFDTRLLFLLSGMTAAISMGGRKMDFRDCLAVGRKKIRTLFLPFLVWSVIVMPFVYDRSEVADIPRLLLQAFNPQNGGYWFLLYLFMFQLLLIGIRFVASRFSSSTSLAASDFWRELLIAFAASWLLFPVYEYLLIFIVCYFAWKYGKRCIFNKAFACVSFVLFVLFYAYVRPVQDCSFVRVMTALCGSFVILTVLRNASKQTPGGELLQYLGRNSLEIYLIHYSLVAITRDYLINTDGFYAVPLFFLLVAVAMIVCWICCKTAVLLKKIPYVPLVLFGRG